ncbi:glycosyltransferase [Bacillaceae bacterium Marseille-Q3522]|nr:glycosyltransferase [Bacillaceae bacterium Marseille-Q3522]
MKPVVSIIVPIYNVEAYLPACLDSILSQTLTKIEVILVNDGSADQSGTICDEYSKKDKRVKVIHSSHRGVSAARNIGVQCASGEYIGFVDGDDYVKPEMYEHLYQLSVATKSDISVCQLGREINGSLINQPVKTGFIEELAHLKAIRELFKGKLYRFSLCNKLFKRSCFTNVSFPEGRIHEDLATTYKLFANAKKTVYSNFIGYIYVKRQNSILTSHYSWKRFDAFTAWDEIILYMKRHYPSLMKEVMFCFAYWSVDNAFFILEQVENKAHRLLYLKRIQQPIRKYFKSIIKNRRLSLKYKSILTLLSCNMKLLLVTKQLHRFCKKNAA